jgi:hypothetical protein
MRFNFFFLGGGAVLKEMFGIYEGEVGKKINKYPKLWGLYLAASHPQPICLQGPI